MTDFRPERPASGAPTPFAPNQGTPRPTAGPAGAPAASSSNGAPQGPGASPGAPPRFAPGAEPAHADGAASDPARPAAAAPAPARPDESVKGRIHIADEVVEKVAGLAALEVEGVADLGGDIERTLENVRERIGLGSRRADQGIKADVKGHDVAITVTVMVEFGHVVLDVARRVQANVAQATRRMLGLNVIEVNVTVDDVRTNRPEEPEDDRVEVTAG